MSVISKYKRKIIFSTTVEYLKYFIFKIRGWKLYNNDVHYDTGSDYGTGVSTNQKVGF